MSYEPSISDYIKNISGDIQYYNYDSFNFPILINKRSSTWIASLSTRINTIKTLLKKIEIGIWDKYWIKIIINIRRVLGTIANVEEVVFFNHNLTSTNLWPKKLNIRKIIFDLTNLHPKKSIIFRSLN